MKVVIFAGGLGTRISEESHLRPKPMIEIGEMPLLWHIMKIYSAQGYNDFVLCLGYKGYAIKEYFLNYYLHNSDVTVDLKSNVIDIHESNSEPFNVTLVDTGLETKTAGRLKKVQKYLGDEDFMLTYGDGVADIKLDELLNFHHSHKGIATMTAVQPEGKFGGIEFNEDGLVSNFKEKPKGDGHWINGGFFVLRPSVFNYLDENADHVMWEDAPLENLTKDKELHIYRHYGFWRCMDALRDKVILEEMWNSNKAPWKKW
ncbi:MAG: glucose-1-phosphate cytidylyltransferase [Bacteroidia bacterium]